MSFEVTVGRPFQSKVNLDLLKLKTDRSNLCNIPNGFNLT